MTDTTPHSTDLAEKSFAEVLQEVFLAGVDGVLENRRDGVRIQLLIRDGHLVDAASIDQEDWLGYHLRRKGRLTVEEFISTMRARDRSPERYGTLLVKRGILSPEEVYQAVLEQLEAIVWKPFAWDWGTVIFRPRQQIGDGWRVRLRLPVPNAIVRGVRRMASPRTLARLGEKETVLEPRYENRDLIECGFNADEYRLLSSVDSRRTIADLVNSGALNPADNLKLLYAFRVMGLVRVGDFQRRSGPIQLKVRTSGDSIAG